MALISPCPHQSLSTLSRQAAGCRCTRLVLPSTCFTCPPLQPPNRWMSVRFLLFFVTPPPPPLLYLCLPAVEYCVSLSPRSGILRIPVSPQWNIAYLCLPAVEYCGLGGYGPSTEARGAVKLSPLKSWSRSEYIHACFTHCQHFPPCSNLYIPGPFNFIFSYVLF